MRARLDLLILVFRRRTGAAIVAMLMALGCCVGLSYADLQPGLDSRENLGAYLDGNLPSNGSDPMPALLSMTGAFTNTLARTPHPGLVPYSLNSPLWSDGSDKERFLGVPYGGTTGNPKIGFNADDYWTYPNGTVIVKNFDLILDERTPATSRRRLETRILIRYDDGSAQCGPAGRPRGCIRGATYKWRADNSDADLVTSPLGINEPIDVIDASGTTKNQVWLYPGPGQCVMCHNQNAGMVLGPKTAQLNKSIMYPTGRTANQLHTFNHLGMLDTDIGNAASYPQYPAMADVADASKTMEHRIRSYISSNCSFCHRPGGMGPVYDMRYETDMLATNLISASGFIRDDLANSRLFVRDSAVPGNLQGIGPMPPLARYVPDPRIVGNGVIPGVYSEWVNSAYDLTSATPISATQLLLTFDRALEPLSAGTAANYAINGLTVSQATPGSGPQANTVTLTTSAQTPATQYVVTINRVQEQAAPQNPIFPNTTITYQSASVPGAPSISSAAPGSGSITLTWDAPSATGGLQISGYQVSCTPGPTIVSSGSTSVTITGLANGTAYTCTVSATNTLGTGPASASVVVTPRTLPSAPTITSIVGASQSASIAFIPAFDGGAPVSSFGASCTSTSPIATFTASGMASPLMISGLVDGIEYSCVVTATNAAGTSAASAPVTVVPQVVPVLQSVMSIKSHGASLHGINIDLSAAIDGAVTVEPRNVGSGHQLVFAFDVPLTGDIQASVIDKSSAAAGLASVTVAGKEATVFLTGVADRQRVTVSLTGVNGNHTFPVSLGFLVGDVSGSRSVTSSDILLSKTRRSISVDVTNYWLDVDTSGAIDAKDTAIIKSRAGAVL